MIALAPITKGAYVTEYKYLEMYNNKTAEVEYIANGEGCYIVEAYVNGKRCYFDATRRMESYGRYRE